jgi:hypothetical protein
MHRSRKQRGTVMRGVRALCRSELLLGKRAVADLLINPVLDLSMLDTTKASGERHNSFLSRVTDTGLVWGLQSNDGWCVSPSNDDTTPASVMPFWSDRAYAARCAVREWANYAPASISLDEFLNVWLPGMSEDGFLVGTNWNGYLVGKECDPTQLRDELLASLNNAP